MAKRAKTESVLSRETRLEAEADAISGAKAAAEQAAEVAKEAAEKRRVVTPVVKAEWPKKTKKARFVREQTEKKPKAKATRTERSSKAVGKMMTKNVSYRPKDEPRAGPKAKGRARP
jgi:hypothetical protein